MENKFKISVEKRKNTILKKREKKILSKSKNNAKKILKGDSSNFVNNEKFNIKKVADVDRIVTKHDRNEFKSAINGMFQVRTIDDDALTHIISHKFYEDKSIITNIPTPNYNYIKLRLRSIFNNEITNNSKNLKINCFITIKFEMDVGEDDDVENGIFFFNSDLFTLNTKFKIEDNLNDIEGQFKENIDKINKSGSGKAFIRVIQMDINISKSKNIFGGNFTELEDKIKLKRACINIKNKDQKCFLWSLLASKYYTIEKKIEVRYYKKYLDKIVVPENATFPVNIDDIESWENANDMRINVFSLNDELELIPEYTRQKNNKNLVNLLLYKDHYIWLKDIDRFEASKSAHHSKYRCEHCLNGVFNTQKNLENHIKTCFSDTIVTKEDLPTKNKDDIMKFRNKSNEFTHPFHVCADFESTLEKYNDVSEGNTKKYQKHVANSYGLLYNCIHDEYSKEISIYNNSDPELVVKNFVEELEELAKYSYDLTQKNKSTKNIIMSDIQKNEHYKSKKCSECKSDYTKENNKCAHHDHINGQFISSICYKCNIQLQYKKFMPVYLHNMKSYDAHLFIGALFKYGYQQTENENITVIPNTAEKYISISKNIQVGTYLKDGIEKPIMYEIRFLDTIAFMASSLDSLSSDLRKGCHDDIIKLRKTFKNTSKQFKDDEEFMMMIQKGVYPYDYIDNYERLNETRLPYKKDFYSKLNNSQISDDDYRTAYTVWKKFNCKTMMDYHNLYLKTDVLLLMDIWENFRMVCSQAYSLDPEYYYTCCSLSWDAMLKLSGVKLELITDAEIYEFFEKSIRGGQSQISTRQALANNKYMENYDEKKEKSFISYFDANNLYGWSQCQFLPFKNFRWNYQQDETKIDEINIDWNKDKIQEKELVYLRDENNEIIKKEIDVEYIDPKYILSLGDKDEKGYELEVSIHLPDNMHDHMNNYPMFPENVSVKKENLNTWQQENYRQSSIKKLILSFTDKDKYIVNYRYLKLALTLGYKLVKVHRVLEFSQTNFLESYILLNTKLRIEASKEKNSFKVSFFKMMVNSCYGKTMEDIKKRINFRLINTEDQALKVKNMTKFIILSPNLVGLHIKKMKIKLCKPIYLGSTILDDSKFLMCNFHYNFMLKQIDRKNIDLLMTDTDSLCYHIKNEDIYEIMHKNKHEFDLSNFPENHFIYNSTNEKIIGKMKDESPEKVITEFVGLRSKLYSFTVDGEDESHNKCKGIKTYVAKKLTIDEYRNTLETNEPLKKVQNSFRSYDHQLFTEETLKVALSAMDDKVFIEKCYLKTINFGHWRIRKNI